MQSNDRKTETLKFLDGPAGKIEAMLSGFEALGALQSVGIVCHPHPLHQGTMHNKVVTTVVRAWQEQNLATLRFNFRGVGESTGEFGHGLGEVEDLQAVLAFVKSINPDRMIWLSGFSFGAYISLKVAMEQPLLAGLITLAPALSAMDFAGLYSPVCPWLVIQGENDELTDAKKVEKWYHSLQLAKVLPQHSKLVLLPGASHFFHGALNRIKAEIQEFMNVQKG